jgi:hypothetical protein
MKFAPVALQQYSHRIAFVHFGAPLIFRRPYPRIRTVATRDIRPSRWDRRKNGTEFLQLSALALG